MKDQLNRQIHLEKIPKRIVSLVPSQTELLFDLGLESSIVGITKFCVHPVHLKKEKTIIGGTKDVHFDKIRTLQPDIILCNKEENTLEMIQGLEQIAPLHISDIYTIEDCLELIQMYGQLFSKEENANQLIGNIKNKHDDFKTFIKDRATLQTVYFIWKKPWMVAAKHTFIDTMMLQNNFENMYSHLDRYPEIELTKAKPKTADLILLSSEPFPFKEEHRKLMKKFFPQSKVLVVNGEAFSWYGSRLIEAFDYFKSLHQDHLNWNVSSSK